MRRVNLVTTIGGRGRAPARGALQPRPLSVGERSDISSLSSTALLGAAVSIARVGTSWVLPAT